MKNLTLLLSTIAFFITLTSCSTTKILMLHPVEQEMVYDNGKEIVKQEKEAIKIVASYDGSFQDYMVFDIEVFNKGNQDMVVTPKRFRVFPLDEQKRNFRSATGNIIYSSQAIEPTEQLPVISQAMERQETTIKRARVVNTVLFVGGVLIGLAGSSSNRRTERFASTELGNSLIQVAQIKRIIDHEKYYSAMDKLSQKQDTWRLENFNTTVLTPNSSIRGNVFIKKYTQAAYLQIVYDTDTEPVSFLFAQRPEYLK